jgi:hypothetical protein
VLTHGITRIERRRTLIWRTQITDIAATIDKDGKLSNAGLHEQMTERVDDSDFRAKTRLRLLKLGFPRESLVRLFADLPQDY